MRITLFHNIIAPYRIPLFAAVAENYELTLLFANSSDSSRKWSQKIEDKNFKSINLKKVGVGPFILNPNIFSVFRNIKTDMYLISDNEENLFTNLCIVFLAKLQSRPYVVWSGHIPINESTIHPADFHKSFFHSRPIKSFFFAITKLGNSIIYRNARSFLAYSEYTRQFLISQNVENDRIVVGTQAMSPTLLPVSTKKRKLPKKINVLYLGYLRPEKSVDLLVKAVLELPSSKIELHIVGDGPEIHNLKAIANNAKNINFYPYANGVEKANWYSSVDLCVLPTYYDPWAHVITESLYYNTPVLITTSAAVSEIIKQGVTGFVINAGDQNAITKILRKMINTPSSVVAMKENIRYADLSRLYDVHADAQNFVKAITMAEGK